MLNIGIVGCGYWGPNLIRNFNQLDDCRVKWICDGNAERLGHVQKLYPHAKASTSYETLVNDPELDGIVICTPVRTHFPMAKMSLEAGKHTFVEKPMSDSFANCQELHELAEANGLTLMVGHTFIYNPVVRKIKETIEAGELGDVLYISCRRLNLGLFQKDINVAWDLAPHDISIILFILNEMPSSVNCQGKAHLDKNIEDVTNMSLNFSNGGFATIQSSWLDPNKVREMTIVGSRQMLVYNDLEPIEKLRVFDKRVDRPPHYDTFGEFHYSYHYGDIHSHYIKQEEPLRIEAQHFLDSINNQTKPDSSALEGMQVVRILEASSESLALGGEQITLSESGQTEPEFVMAK